VYIATQRALITELLARNKRPRSHCLRYPRAADT
jgi:hypothetical protein